MEKKIKLRDRIKDFSKSEFNSDFDKLQNDQRSDVLLHFYIKEIHNKTKTEISQEQIEFGNVDGKDDLSIDFIHKDDNVVTIIQAKYRGTTIENEPHENIIDFKSVINRLIDNEFIPNKKLKEILTDINLDSDEFNMIYITTAPITGHSRTESNIEPVYSNKIPDIGDRVNYIFLDGKDLNDELSNAIAMSKGFNDEEFELYAYNSEDFGRQILSVEVNNRKQCILAVESTQLVNAHNRVKDNLFNLNIRNFIGNSIQNKRIKRTIEEDAKNFYFFNNGISCLSNQITIDQKSGKVKLKGLQVINGAQTVKSLVLGHKKTTLLEKPVVLVRITEIAESYSTERVFIDSITKFNNSQNIVKVSDFRSNDPIQIDIQRKFAKINLPGTTKQVTYLRKRTDDAGKRTNEIIKFEDFCKALHAYMIDPISFSSSTSYLFDEKGGYSKIFGDGEKVDEYILDEEFEKRAAIWWLVKAFSEQILIDRKEASELNKNALQGRWLIVYASRILLERFFGDPYKPISKHYKSGWHMGQGKIGEWYLDLYKLAKQSVIYLYTTDQQSMKGFLHRNWLRNQSTVEKIKNYCLNAPIKEILPSPNKD